MAPQAQRKSKRKTVPRYVIERGGWYYFRRRIPAELIATIGKEEFKEALGTTDLAEAKVLAERKAVETTAIIEVARRRIPPRILRPSSGSKAGKPAALDWMTPEERRYVAQRSAYDLVWLDDEARLRRPSLEQRDLYLDQRYEQWQEATEALTRGALPRELKGELRSAMEGLGVSLSEGSEEYQRLVVEFLRARVEALRVITDRGFGRGYRESPEAPAVPDSVLRRSTGTNGGNGEQGAVKGPDTLDTILAAWKRERSPVERTADEVARIVKEFHEVTSSGEPLHLKSITRAMVQQFREAMVNRDRPLAMVTVKKRLGLLKALLSLAEEKGLIDENPADKVRSGVKKGRTPQQRFPFTTGHLQALFSDDPQRLAVVVKMPMYADALHWVPVLALATGCRREELCQLRVADVVEEKGNWHLDVTDMEDDQQLKNESSRRKVPLHSFIAFDLGFVAYVQSLPKEGRLFPQLKPDAYGRYGENFGKRFTRYLRETVGIGDRKRTFHSFRHSFKDLCRDAGISKEIHDRLTGHASFDVGSSYGNGPSLRTLHEAVERIDLASVLQKLKQARENSMDSMPLDEAAEEAAR